MQTEPSPPQELSRAPELYLWAVPYSRADTECVTTPACPEDKGCVLYSTLMVFETVELLHL